MFCAISTSMENDIKDDFEFIKDEVMGVLLFGSSVRYERTERSDIDICIVGPKNREVILKIFQRVGGKYDVKVFEELPLMVQMGIIENNIVIFGDEVDLSYYFYRYRKRWRDNKFRIEKYSFSSPAEMKEARRRWLDEQKPPLPEKD